MADSTRPKDANAVQVGGNHYKKQPYQHWDFVLDASVPYLEAMVAKYVSRHMNKNGRQDLEKALHFLKKLEEEIDAVRVGKRHRVSSRASVLAGLARNDAVAVLEFITLNNLPTPEARIIYKTVLWAEGGDILTAIAELGLLIELTYPEPPEAGYVNQD